MTKDDKTIAGLIPLLGIFGLSIVSIILWAIKKDESEFIDFHGKEYVNFTISVIIYSAISGLLCIILIGFVLLAAVAIFSFVVSVIATIKAFNNEYYTYPLIIRFIK